MKKSYIILIAVVGLIFIFGGNACSTYNGFVDKSENLKNAWANVETQYQRRFDLIGNLVKTVQGAADFEKSTLTDLVEARSRVGQTNINADDLTEENLQKFTQAQGQMTSALSRLLVVVERYPDLKANQNFLELQAQLEGTENRIAVSRSDFNAVASDYNKAIQRMPGRIYAGLFGFFPKALFKSESGAERAVDVNFDFKNK